MRSARGFFLFSKTKCHDGVSANAGFLFELGNQLLFQIVRIGNHFASGNLLVGCAVVAQLADCEAVFFAGAYRRPKSPTGHRTRVIKFASSRCRIQRRAGLVIGKINKCGLGFFVLAQNSCRAIAGKIRREPLYRLCCALPDLRCSPGICEGKLCQPFLQSHCIQLADGESSIAALCASLATHQPFTALAGRFSQCDVNNLYKFPVRCWQGALHT